MRLCASVNIMYSASVRITRKEHPFLCYLNEMSLVPISRTTFLQSLKAVQFYQNLVLCLGVKKKKNNICIIHKLFYILAASSTDLFN